jgi:hypothetical protein
MGYAYSLGMIDELKAQGYFPNNNNDFYLIYINGKINDDFG